MMHGHEKSDLASQAIQNLVGPEAFEAVQRFIQRDKLPATNTTDLFHRIYVLVIERSHDVAYLTTFLGQLNMN
jgi:hypothetical protein